MTTVITVHPPDTSDVRTGTLWLTDTGNRLLVMTPITDSVFNVIFWPDMVGDCTIPGEDAVGSMLAADVLALSSELIAEPMPELLKFIEDLTEEVMAAARRMAERGTRG